MANDLIDSPGDDSMPDAHASPAGGGTFPTMPSWTSSTIAVSSCAQSKTYASLASTLLCSTASSVSDVSGTQAILSGSEASSVRQGIFGYEAAHTSRYKHEVDAGSFLVIVGSHDDETAERVRQAFAAHRGRFVNYCAQWPSRSLIP